MMARRDNKKRHVVRSGRRIVAAPGPLYQMHAALRRHFHLPDARIGSDVFTTPARLCGKNQTVFKHIAD